MVSISHENTQIDVVTIATMPVGSYAIDDNRNYFYRTTYTAVCLNDHGQTYSDNAAKVNNHSVRLLKPGTVITIEIK